LEELGCGGMGMVHLAWDLVLRHVVAIKTLRRTEIISRDRIERLRREAALQMRLCHPGIVRLLHFEPWEASVGPYLLMEYVPWATGDRWLAEAGTQGLPPLAVIQVGIKLCEALAFAHDAGVLHLDIKPSNVYVDPGGQQPKLGDFGIATAMGSHRSDAFVTRLIGTPGYMAPEQKALGERVGPWTDVYQLAATLWELITGERVSKGATPSIIEGPCGVWLPILRQGLAECIDRRVGEARTFGALLTDALEQAGARETRSPGVANGPDE
jgi:serine/threonine-protein kinase